MVMHMLGASDVERVLTGLGSMIDMKDSSLKIRQADSYRIVDEIA